jgi:hypothetical protein
MKETFTSQKDKPKMKTYIKIKSEQKENVEYEDKPIKNKENAFIHQAKEKELVERLYQNDRYRLR